MIKVSITIEHILKKTHEYQLRVEGKTFVMDLKKLGCETYQVSSEFLQGFEAEGPKTSCNRARLEYS
jgi:hypothetical protein